MRIGRQTERIWDYHSLAYGTCRFSTIVRFYPGQIGLLMVILSLVYVFAIKIINWL